MAIDPYSLCPGGTGKKIKFCCSDLLGDLKTLDRMMEGEQHEAALRHIQSIESPQQPRECLLAMKIQLLRASQRQQDAQAAVKSFLEHFPNNPIALAESAIDTAVIGDGSEAMQLLQKALTNSGKQLYSQVYGAMSVVAQTLANTGHIWAARALWYLQTMVCDDDNQPRTFLAEVSRSPSIPLLLKDEPHLGECPADAPWKPSYDEAMQPLAQANWVEVVQRLEKLVEQIPNEPAPWQSLAVVRSWLADRDGAKAALETLATLDIPVEDAAEARATAMLMTDDSLGDSIDGLRLTYPVNDAGELAGRFSTWKQAVAMPFDSGAFTEADEVPPKAIFWLLDRPTPEAGETLSLETIPCVLGQAMLFGRQTDCEARLVVSGASASEREKITESLNAVADGQITGPPEEEKITQLSATRSLLRRPWRLPPGTSAETVELLSREHLEQALLDEWPALKLGVLEGRSPREVTDDPSAQIKLMAAILVLESWVQQMGESFDFNRLRARLALPDLGPIDPDQIALERVPLMRLARTMVEKLSDEALLNGFRRAAVYSVGEAVGVFGREVIQRPDISANEKQLAFASLAQSEPDPEQALNYIEQGRQQAEAAGKSSAPWDLNELELRMARGEVEEGARLFEHLKEKHLQEPGVAESLRGFLQRAGIIDAQGRPVVPEDPMAAHPEMTPTDEPPAAGLWTPDSETPTGGKSKLWTPDEG